MRIITHACPACGTVIAANELENRRVMKCPGLHCEEVHRFDDINHVDREHFLENKDQYRL